MLELLLNSFDKDKNVLDYTWSAVANGTTNFLGFGAADANYGYSLGGWNGSSGHVLLRRYHPSGGGQWVNLANIPAQRMAHCGLVHNDYIYIIGGSTTNTYIAQNTVYRYTISNGQWATMATLPTGVVLAECCVLNNKIYVFGGSIVNGSANIYRPTIFVAYVYDIATNTWETLNLNISPRSVTAACAYNGLIYILGGGNLNVSSTALNDFYSYNPETGEIIQLANSINGVAARNQMFEVDGQIIACFGITNISSNITSKQTQRYDIETNTWHLYDFTSAGGRAHASGFKLRRRIYLYGGTIDNTATNSTILFS